MKTISNWQRVWVVLLCSILLQPWGAYRLMAADITPGYTFSSGEQNVTHTKLNNAAAGTINTTFYSGKSSAGADPNTAFEILLRDTSLDVFKRSTLQAAVFDHAAFLSSRTVKTIPVGGDGLLLMDSAAGNAYKQMVLSNALFAGAATPGTTTNGNKFPTLWSGALGTMDVSNLIAGASYHAFPTNQDLISLVTSNGGRAYKSIALEDALIRGHTVDPQHKGSNSFLTWGPNGLRQIRATNLIDSLTLAGASTNAVIDFLEAGALQKMTLQMLATLIQSNSVRVVQSVYTGPTNITCVSGNFSNVTTIGSSTLSNVITPRFTTSKVLVRVVLSASSQGGGDGGYMRVMRNATQPIGVGDSLGNRISAGSPILNLADAGTTVWEYLDSPGSASAVSYNVQVGGVTGNTIYINRDSSDADTSANGRYVSTLTLTEIYQ